MPTDVSTAHGLDFDHCYEAMSSRDRRFDGRFFIGVHTTGIYCRPICPSRTPMRKNVTFYRHQAAAEDAGFRPCRRCQPDTAPGSPDWVGSAAVVERALRLIDEGGLDEATVDTLAARLHVGGRHLRRLFSDHLGTSPDAVARTRRAHVARRLLVDTDLRIADIAFAAGFGSVRQCNDVVRSTFHATPSEVRAAGGTRPAPDASGLSLRLGFRPPFDAAAVLGWFASRAVPGLEVVDRIGVRRAVRVGEDIVVITLTPAPGHVTLAVDTLPHGSLRAVVTGAKRLFDLDADPDAIDAHLGSDPVLGPLVRARPGIRAPSSWSGFEASVRAVVGQQISVAAARTVLGRIVATFGEGAFPEPHHLVDAPLEALGIIGRRAATIRDIAHRVITGDLALDGTMPHDDLVVALVSIPGIGTWTAEYVALRSGEPDAFPAGDLHLMRVLGVTNERGATAMAAPWRPWRSYAAMHLWQASADPPARKVNP